MHCQFNRVVPISLVNNITIGNNGYDVTIDIRKQPIHYRLFPVITGTASNNGYDVTDALPIQCGYSITVMTSTIDILMNNQFITDCTRWWVPPGGLTPPRTPRLTVGKCF